MDNAAAYYIASPTSIEVVLQKIHVNDATVTIHEHQPFALRLLCQKIADGSTSHIFLPCDIAAMGESGDFGVEFGQMVVGRAVVGHDDFDVVNKAVGLTAERTCKFAAVVVVNGDENGEYHER